MKTYGFSTEIDAAHEAAIVWEAYLSSTDAAERGSLSLEGSALFSMLKNQPGWIPSR